MTSLPPGALLILGPFLLPLLPPLGRRIGLVLLPVLSGLHLLALPEGLEVVRTVAGLELMPVRIDGLSLVWGYIFHIAAFVSALYACHRDAPGEHGAGLVYAGAAIGAVFAGDLVTLFVYWELTAIASVFLIWARRTETALRAGMRYLIIQVGSGVVLLAGIVMRYGAAGRTAESLTFGELGLVDLPTALIFVAFGIKAAFPLLHNWLQDAYPEATESGAVFLSAFTTKMAIYALARGFPGTEMLIWIGALMTAFPIFYAVIENDLRRVLAYSLNNQLGFMVVGIGIGSELALNGTAAHAFSHILYKGLLFMSMGAVLMRTGTVKGSELGGLYKSMPWTTVFCSVGAASISAFPLFSGFISKSLILSAVAKEEHFFVWMVLLFASAGVFHHSGIKIPYFAFFAHDSGKRVKEAPRNMLWAMGITAALCVLLGVFPGALYSILPFPLDYHPYSVSHVINQLQLLFFSALAFTVLVRNGIYPPELRSVNLDTDWSYRRALPAVMGVLTRLGGSAWAGVLGGLQRILDRLLRGVYRLHGPEGVLARTWPIGHIALCAVVMLLGCILFYYRA